MLGRFACIAGLNYDSSFDPKSDRNSGQADLAVRIANKNGKGIIRWGGNGLNREDIVELMRTELSNRGYEGKVTVATKGEDSPGFVVRGTGPETNSTAVDPSISE